MNEQEFSELLESRNAELISPKAQEQFQKKVRKAMNRSLYGRILLSVLLIGVLAVGLFFGTAGITDLLCYRPQAEAGFLDTEQGENTWENEDFTILLEDTISTYFPGKYCWMMEPVQSYGFGRYSAPLSITEAYGPVISGQENGEMKIYLSHLDLGRAPLFIEAMEFLDPGLPANTLEEMGIPYPADIRQELDNLPKSAWLDVSLSFPESIPSQEAARIMNEAPDISVRWLALEGQNTSIYQQWAGGMFTDHVRGIQMTPEAAAKYPGYVLPDVVTGQDLEQCLISRLQLLADHPDFVALMETQFENIISMPRLKERLNRAQEGWACYGIRLVGSPDGIRQLMDEFSITYAVINDVKTSRFEQ